MPTARANGATATSTQINTILMKYMTKMTTSSMTITIESRPSASHLIRSWVSVSAFGFWSWVCWNAGRLRSSTTTWLLTLWMRPLSTSISRATRK